MALPSPTASSHSILKQPMRNAASYLTALSDADARARKLSTDDASSGPAFSLRSSVRTDDDVSYVTTDDSASEDFYDDTLDKPPHPPTSEQTFSTRHSEFGHCSNEAYRCTSAHQPGSKILSFAEEEPPYYILVTVYLSYLILIVLGHLRDFVGKRFCREAYSHLMPRNVSTSIQYTNPI